MAPEMLLSPVRFPRSLDISAVALDRLADVGVSVEW